jgi:hypothetical protein
MDFKKHDIVFLNPPEEADPQDGALFPEPEYDMPVDVGLEVYFSQCAIEEGQPNSYTGTVSDVQDSEGETIFYVEPSPPPTELPYPIFAKVQDVVQLMGIFSPKLKTFVHIQSFDEETRSKPLTVKKDDFTGGKIGRQGNGPRSIRITGGGVDVIYKLKYCIDGKRLQPHHDPDYNKNQTELYQAALDKFVSLYNPKNGTMKTFEFTCYKNNYVAE